MEGNLQEVERLTREVERLRDKCVGLSISNKEYKAELTRISGLTQHCPLCEARDKVIALAEEELEFMHEEDHSPSYLAEGCDVCRIMAAIRALKEKR